MASAAMLSLSACNDLNEQEYEGNNYLSADQRLATNEVIPDRVKATYDGMFNYIGKGGTSGLSKGQRADDFGLVMALMGGDLEGADAACGDNNYNWFSVCGDLSSRNANYAVKNLGAERSNKQYINVDVALGLRARANLAMGKWADAAADAEKVINSGRYTPATREEVSVPGFDDATSGDGHAWIWAVLRTEADAQDNAGYGNYQSSAAWNCAFSGDGYAAATGNTPVINQLLYDKIPATDVRKGWWLNAQKHSPNWANLSWTDPDNGRVAKGDQMADFVLKNGNKSALQPYTNIKFGMKNGVGATTNMNDFPLMRIEEMYLIAAEGYAKSGNEAKAREILTNFVKTYRDPSYDINGRGLSLADEIWFQRRVELWGEGFFTVDAKRLGKPIVRFHQGVANNLPSAFQFNVAADDGWLNMRFPQSEKNNNLSIVDNEGGSLPVAGQNGSLRDGVTD